MSDEQKPLQSKQLTERLDLEFALDAAQLGVWELDPVTNLLNWDDRCRQLFGINSDNRLSYEQAISHIHPDDLERVEKAVKWAMSPDSGGDYNITYRTIGADDHLLRWVRFIGKSYFNERGEIQRFAGIAQNVTQEVNARQQELASVIEKTPYYVTIANLDGSIRYMNPYGQQLLGLNVLNVTTKTINDLYPANDLEKITDEVLPSLLAGKNWNERISTIQQITGELIPIDATGFLLVDPISGQPEASVILGRDLSSELKSQQQQLQMMQHLKANEANLRSVIEAAPAGIALFVGRELIVRIPNQTFINIVGKGQDIEGQPLWKIMPELESQPFLQILDDVYTSGKTYQSFKTQVEIIQHGLLTQNYYNITFTPLFDSEGKVYAILDISVDVTEHVLAQQRVERSQLQLLTLFEQSPVAIAIIDKTDLTFNMANPFYGELVGRKPEEIVGRPLLEAMPELQGQGFDELLNQVIATGIPFTSKETAVNMLRNNQLETMYADLTYQPLFETDDYISGVMVVATDVTLQVLARQKIQEAESSLRGAVELAELGTWQMDMATGILDYSQRLKDWFGIEKDEIVTVRKAYKCVRESDRARIKDAINQAIIAGINGILDVEYTIHSGHAGKEKILHMQGRVLFDTNGKAYKINGLVQNVTHQRKVRLALENQVQQRTEELKTANNELIAANEELDKSNKLLELSNQNLQQFAYVASHDLQEPLRKIKSFGDLLRMRYGNELGKGTDFIHRMQTAAERMSVLIEDLLVFSRISSQNEVAEPVELNEVINIVINDLEITIQETEAKLSIGSLPTVSGNKSQLSHLFLNLFSNALKFRHTNIPVLISVNAQIITAADLPVNLRPTRATAAYHRIEVSDNGIGFDQKYADRIFQVFQRLHGKNEYAGTGIGLAICEKVVTNHGGAIMAISQKDQGATFVIFLPI